jgi:hypothetical protein
MVTEGKTKQALSALNAVLVHARTLAFERRPHELLANVLDIAELLPTLIFRADDTTADFRAHLEDLVALDAGFEVALERYDA